MVQVAAQEIAEGPTPDRMAAIASHIIGQRRWGPIVALVGPATSAITSCNHLDKYIAMTYVLRRDSPGLPLSEVDERPSALCMCSYYPLYPPPLGACLDTSLGQALEMPCTPDIMLFPSDLAPFAKLAQCGASLDQAASSAGDPNTVCINPGRLVKDKSGATYAWLQASKACLCYLGGACISLHPCMCLVTAQQWAASNVMSHGWQSGGAAEAKADWAS